MPGPYTSRNSTSLGGLANGVPHAAGSVSSGRYAINSLPNALSQVFLFVCIYDLINPKNYSNIMQYN